MSKQKTIGIIGLGLIGGSIGLACKKAGWKVLGADENESHRTEAIELGLIDETFTTDDLVKNSDIIAICTPVHAIVELLPQILDRVERHQSVFDVGSTKKSICDVVKEHSSRGRFVAGHPLAGTEFSGPKAAIDELFKGKKNIICEETLSDNDAMDSVLEVFEILEMQSLAMNPEDHDKHIAYVSHLSHVSSFMLGKTVLDIEKDEKAIFNLAGTGFESTVRLAKSSPKTWSSIFASNEKHVSDALGSYIEFLQVFKNALDKKDIEGMEKMMTEANGINKVLTGMKSGIIRV